MILGKNRELLDEINRFIEICSVGIEDFTTAFHHYIANGIDGEFKYSVEKVKKYESDADQQLYKIKNLLYGKFLLPEAREDIAILLGRFDDIIDDAMHTLKFVLTRNLSPIKNETITEQYVVMLNALSDCFSKTAEAARMVFGPQKTNDLKNLTEEAGDFETVCDDAEDKIVTEIFSTKAHDLEKLLHAKLAERVSSIADSCEHTASSINIINLKRVL